MNLKRICNRSIIKFKREIPTILTIVGVIGVAATAVLSINATTKASELKQEMEEKAERELTRFETAITVLPAYIPAIVSGVATMSCIIGANILNKQQQASLASAYALASNILRQYKSKVIEMCGEETHNKIMESITIEKSEDKYLYAPTMVGGMSLDIDEHDSDDTRLFYDVFSQRYFESTLCRVIQAEYYLNRDYMLRGYASLNDFYNFLGIEPTNYGKIVGSSNYNSDAYWLDFNHRKVFIDDDLECCMIEMLYPPESGFNDC